MNLVEVATIVIGTGLLTAIAIVKGNLEKSKVRAKVRVSTKAKK